MHPKWRMEILKMIVLFSANLDVLCLFVQLSMGDKIFVPLMGDILVDSGNLAGKSDRMEVIFIVILRELVLLLDE